MSSFNGQVTFTCTRPNLKVQIIRDLLRSAVTEAARFPPDSDAERIFDNLSQFLGRTTAITFGVDSEKRPEIAALRDFWTLAQSGANYREVWDAFILLSLDAHNEWMEALNETIPADLAAPAELRPEAGDDPNSSGSRLSKKSTPLSETSPTMS